MSRALQLAGLGRSSVSPNPMVGCVITHKDSIIGEGFHQKYGGPHAEVNAVDAVKDQKLLPESTVYVTLEPCSHFGKTPPCSDLLIGKKVKKVVVAAMDPNPEVNGRGIKKLRESGIEVVTGVLEEESIDLNRRFYTFHQKKRPYIILKWAETTDGFIARENYDSKWISNSYSRQLVHRWRCEEDAILVGTNTAIHDNPSLTTRDWKGKNPVRVLIDMNVKVKNSHFLFNSDARTLVINSKFAREDKNIEWIRISENDSEKKLLNELYRRNIQSLIIEGGSYTLQRFIDKDLWDEARIFVSDTKFKKGIFSPALDREPSTSESVFNDKLYFYKNDAKR